MSDNGSIDFSDAALAAKRAARRRMMAESAGFLEPPYGVPTLVRLAAFTHKLDRITRSLLKKAGKDESDIRAAIKLQLYRGEEYSLMLRIEDDASPLNGRTVAITCRVPDLDESKSAGKKAYRPGAADMLKFFTASLPPGSPAEDEDQWEDYLTNLVSEQALFSMTFKPDADTNPTTGKKYPFSRMDSVQRMEAYTGDSTDGAEQEAADTAYAQGEPAQEPVPPPPPPAPAPKPRTAPKPRPAAK